MLEGSFFIASESIRILKNPKKIIPEQQIKKDSPIKSNPGFDKTIYFSSK